MCLTNRFFAVNCANVINGEIGFCACHSCSELKGDCDFNDQCQEGLTCGSNNCHAFFGFDAHIDCCYDASNGNEDFCTTDKPCEVNEGDCDSNDECKSHLFCGSNNCPDSLGFLSTVDCCEPKGNNKLKNCSHDVYMLGRKKWGNNRQKIEEEEKFH